MCRINLRFHRRESIPWWHGAGPARSRRTTPTAGNDPQNPGLLSGTQKAAPLPPFACNSLHLRAK